MRTVVLSIVCSLCLGLILLQGLLMVFSPALMRKLLRYYPKTWATDLDSLSNGRMRAFGLSFFVFGILGLNATLAPKMELAPFTMQLAFWVGLVLGGLISGGMTRWPLHTAKTMGWEESARRLGGAENEIAMKLRFVGVSCLLGVAYIGYAALTH